MNECRVWIEFLSRLTKGRATMPEAVGLHSHLLECEYCSKEMREQYKE